jgi:hypothetical protein
MYSSSAMIGGCGGDWANTQSESQGQCDRSRHERWVWCVTSWRLSNQSNTTNMPQTHTPALLLVLTVTATVLLLTAQSSSAQFFNMDDMFGGGGGGGGQQFFFQQDGGSPFQQQQQQEQPKELSTPCVNDLSVKKIRLMKFRMHLVRTSYAALQQDGV